jgi:hypothetical protein
VKQAVRADKRSARGSAVALGFRTHSGWTAVVAVAPSNHGIDVIDRRRIELADSKIPNSVQPYHAAEGLDLKPAEAFITRCIASTRDLAHRGVKAMVDDLSKDGHMVAGCGLVLASGKPLPGLAAILASHSLIHTAEGELYRDAIVHASKRLKLPVTAIKERELFEQGAARLGITADPLQRRINEIGRTLGPPWTQDQKYAAIVAWLVLKASAR